MRGKQDLDLEHQWETSSLQMVSSSALTKALREWREQQEEAATGGEGTAPYTAASAVAAAAEE